jgi:hypothetical protein
MRWTILFLLTCLSSRASAHSLAFTVLELRQLSEDEYVLAWQRLPPNVPADAATLLLRPFFPPQCSLRSSKLRCSAPGLSGRLGFAGLGEQSASVLVRVRWQRGEASYSLTAAHPELRIEPPSAHAEPWLSRISGFTWLGIEHIWLGWDHLLFVLGLLALVRSTPMLLKTITAFTLAHSITLSVAVLGWGTLPSAPVEATIALSIVLVAAEALKRARGAPPTMAPWWVAFSFGLLHGFGFAGALSEHQIAARVLPLVLLSFNLGVELGQVAFVIVALGIGRVLPARLVPVTHYASGAIGSYWLIERLALLG